MKPISPPFVWPDLLGPEKDVDPDSEPPNHTPRTLLGALTTPCGWVEKEATASTAVASLMQARWWPRHLGVVIDQPDDRWHCEPKDGARTWLRLKETQDGWEDEQGNLVLKAPEGGTGDSFLGALLLGLRACVGGLDAKSVRQLPSNVDSLRASFAELMPVGPTDAMVFRAPTVVPGALAAGEPLTALHPMPQGDLPRTLATLKGEVARALGAALEERLSSRAPGALHAQVFEALGQQYPGGFPPGLSWTLRVNPAATAVDLLIFSGDDCVAGGAVSSLPPPSHAAVMDTDLTFSKGVRLFARHFQATPRPWRHPGHTARHGEGALCDVPLQGSIYLLGHGGRHRPFIYGERFVITRAAGLSPQALARSLIDNGLPRQFSGTLFLEACNAGGSGPHDDVYARRLLGALKARGFDKLSVAAPLGAAMLRGGMVAMPTVVQMELPRTIAASRASLASAGAMLARAEQAGDTELAGIARRWKTHERSQLKTLRGLEAAFQERLPDVNGFIVSEQAEPLYTQNLRGHFGPGTGTRPHWLKRLFGRQ